MKLYQSNGYANMKDMIECETPFCLIIGGRGTGKTYNALHWLLESKQLFIYMRRTGKQMGVVTKDKLSPIVQVGRDMGMKLTTEPLGEYVSAVYHVGDDDKASGDPVALIMALNSISSIRSFDASSVSVLLYDEAIPEKSERAIRAEDECFLQCVESIARNRELQGNKPLKVVVMANANNLEAPILRALNCVRTLDNMRRKKQTQNIDKTTGLSIFLLKDSPISAEKRQTALYKLTLGKGDFVDMALDNSFSADNYTDISVRPLNEYVPIATIGSICLYQHKNNYTWYVSETISGKPEQFENVVTDRHRFRKKYAKSWADYFSKRLVFENVNAKVFYKAVMMDNL